MANHSQLDDVQAVSVLGLPLMPFTIEQTLDKVEELIQTKQPHYFILANLHYALLADRDAGLRRVNERAAFLVADSKSLVWMSRRGCTPLPERIAGVDLVGALCQRAGQKGYRVFLLRGGRGAGRSAAHCLHQGFPSLHIAGIAAPVLERLSRHGQERLIAHIHDAQPELLLAALGQPQGELWLAKHAQALGAPVAVQVGSALDCLLSRVQHSNAWIPKLGLEWAYRIYQEPGRLVSRYAHDALFAAGAFCRGLVGPAGRGTNSS
jgi:N-acetylglucosaminyldiphosphoundecaprenol N-acetyl-beta-D-mannosaminyltransferase